MIATTVTEAEILADVLSPNQGDFTAEVAQVVLNWKFSRRSTAHINALARRNQKGTIQKLSRPSPRQTVMPP